MIRRKSFAFTMIDSVVVATVAGMAVAVALPAIQQQREVVRDKGCRNKLAQLGLAMHNYHDSHRMFPPGIIGQNSSTKDAGLCQFVSTSEVCDNPGFARASAFTMILPFVEERRAYSSYNFSLACCAPANITSTSTVVKTYVCPSNPRGANGMESPYYDSSPGPTDYVLSMGGVGLFTCDNPFVINLGGMSKSSIPGRMRKASGLFNVNSSVSIDKIRDGTSNTIMIGESAGGPELFVGRANSVLVDGASRMDSASAKVAIGNPWSMGYIGSGRTGVGQGLGSVFGATAWNAWYDDQGNLVDPANGDKWFFYPINEGKLKFNRPTWAKSSRPEPKFDAKDGSGLPGSLGSVQGFRSTHPGMVHILICDGSVKPFSDATDPKVLVGWSSIVGREPISAPQ
jgi:competence protein ComGC